MQFKGKQMNQTWENGKKTNLGSNFGSFGANLDPPNVCHEFYHYHTLEIVTKYHCMQFVGKSMIQTQ